MTTSNNSIPDPTEIAWAGLDEQELVNAYWSHVAPVLEADGYDVETHRPTYQWLRDQGFRPLLYTLRENHNTTFSTFWNEKLGLSEPNKQGYEWGITHAETIELLEAYLTSVGDRGELDDTTVNTIRYRLAKYVRLYTTENGTEDLITPVKRGTDIPAHEAVDACWAAFDRLHKNVESEATEARIHRAVSNWYNHLVRRKRAEINPAEGLDEEYNWQGGTSDPPQLTPDHIKSLSETADTPADRLLIVALAAWGLRSSEVAALHRSQVVIPETDQTPYIRFDERKNGPGEVSALYGLTTYEDRVMELGERQGWNGYLFPSSGSSTGHITRDTVLNRFDRLATTAGLPEAIDGEKPVPQMARRFWYDAYSEVLDNVLEGIDEIAADQGSKDAGVVLRNYLSQERNRKLRRKQMRNRLTEGFEEGGSEGSVEIQREGRL